MNVNGGAALTAASTYPPVLGGLPTDHSLLMAELELASWASLSDHPSPAPPTFRITIPEGAERAAIATWVDASKDVPTPDDSATSVFTKRFARANLSTRPGIALHSLVHDLPDLVLDSTEEATEFYHLLVESMRTQAESCGVGKTSSRTERSAPARDPNANPFHHLLHATKCNLGKWKGAIWKEYREE